MNEETILKVASVLETWNPLGEQANTIEDLEGYRYEAIDILSAINVMSGPNKIEKAIEQVLSEAFNLEVDHVALLKAVKEISHILSMEN